VHFLSTIEGQGISGSMQGGNPSLLRVESAASASVAVAVTSAELLILQDDHSLEHCEELREYVHAGGLAV
jgi:hypothetical protein